MTSPAQPAQQVRKRSRGGLDSTYEKPWSPISDPEIDVLGTHAHKRMLTEVTTLGSLVFLQWAAQAQQEPNQRAAFVLLHDIPPPTCHRRLRAVGAVGWICAFGQLACIHLRVSPPLRCPLSRGAGHGHRSRSTADALRGRLGYQPPHRRDGTWRAEAAAPVKVEQRCRGDGPARCGPALRRVWLGGSSRRLGEASPPPVAARPSGSQPVPAPAAACHRRPPTSVSSPWRLHLNLLSLRSLHVVFCVCRQARFRRRVWWRRRRRLAAPPPPPWVGRLRAPQQPQ